VRHAGETEASARGEDGKQGVKTNLMQRNKFVVAGLAGLSLALAGSGFLTRPQNPAVANVGAPVKSEMMKSENAKSDKRDKKEALEKVVKTEEEWKKILTPMQFYVLREKGTERAFAGDHKYHGPGAYRCAGCDFELYDAKTMFDSGTGWPSFYQAIKGHVTEITDADGSRTEVLCARCDGHLGHVFNDGPQPTGLRYCMNAVAIKFVPAEAKK